MKKNKVNVMLIASVIVLVVVVYFGQRNFNAQDEPTIATHIAVVNSDESTSESTNDDVILNVVNGGIINVYLKGDNEDSNRYIGYRIEQLTKERDAGTKKSNYKVWNITNVSEYQLANTGRFEETLSIVKGGEWDIAISEEGASDFIGGYQHGDEITTDVTFNIEGEEFSDLKNFKGNIDEFTLTAQSILYRDSNMTEELEELGSSSKTYTFTKDGLVIEREVTFTQDANLNKSYLAMLPIQRKTDSGLQVTDTIATNDGREFSVADSGFNIPEVTNIKANSAIIYGKVSGITASVEILEKSPAEPTTFKLSNSELYNKLYFSFVGDGYKVKSGDVWKIKTLYKIDTSN